MASERQDISLINYEGDVNARKPNGYFPLQLAALRAQFQIVQILLSLGADVNQVDGTFLTPLCSAVLIGRDENISAVLDAGSDVSCATSKGPLQCATDPSTILQLLAEGADVNERNVRGETPLYHSVQGRPNEDCAKLLLRKGARVDDADTAGRTPLHVADSLKLIKLLLAHGAEVDVKDKEGQTPYDIFCGRAKMWNFSWNFSKPEMAQAKLLLAPTSSKGNICSIC